MIVDALGYTNESILNKKITYSFPYVVGVSSGDFADIYHDESYISKLVLDKIEALPVEDGLLPPLSAAEVKLNVDTFEHVSRVIQRVETMGYRCDNNFLNLSMMIGNLDKIFSIYQFILIFVFICMLVVCKILFDFMDQSKLTFVEHLNHIGVTKQQMRHYIVKDHLCLFIMITLFSILCLFLMMPLLDRMFYFVNGLIFQMQLEANKAVPIFTFSLKHVALCAFLTSVVMGVAGYQFYRRARRCDLC